MSERVRLIGKAAGQRIDEDQPVAVMDSGQSASAELKHVVMVHAKVSEQDAQYLIDEGYWSSAMYRFRMHLALKNMQHETMTEEDDG